MKWWIIIQLGVRKIFRLSVMYVATIVGTIYLFTLGMLKRKGREIFYVLHDSLFFSASGSVGPQIPVIKQEEVIKNNAVTTLLEPVFENGNVTLTELTVISNLVSATAPKTIFEFGTFNGRTTINLAANAPAGASVYTLDLPKESLNNTRLAVEAGDKLFIAKDESGARYKKDGLPGKITQLYGDSATFDFSPYFNGVDFIFVDAAHSYEYVINDSHLALKLLRGGKGVILWHDYNQPKHWPGLMRALNELYRSDPAFKALRHIEGTSMVYLRKD